MAAVLEQTLLTMVNHINTAMVGSLGKNATASIGAVSSTIWLITGIFAAVAIGFSVPSGETWARGTSKKQSILAYLFSVQGLP